MQFLGQTLRKHLACGTYAAALVCSLVVYQKSVVTRQPMVEQTQVSVDLTKDLERTIAKYSDRPVLRPLYQALDKVYSGRSSTRDRRNASGGATFKTSR